VTTTPTAADVLVQLDKVISQLRLRSKSAVTFPEHQYWTTHLNALGDFRALIRSQEFLQAVTEEHRRREARLGGTSG
jgi:hypothetical protein